MKFDVERRAELLFGTERSEAKDLALMLAREACAAQAEEIALAIENQGALCGNREMSIRELCARLVRSEFAAPTPPRSRENPDVLIEIRDLLRQLVDKP